MEGVEWLMGNYSAAYETSACKRIFVLRSLPALYSMRPTRYGDTPI